MSVRCYVFSEFHQLLSLSLIDLLKKWLTTNCLAGWLSSMLSLFTYLRNFLFSYLLTWLLTYLSNITTCNIHAFT